MASGRIVPFIGVYDVFSASLAARYYDSLFLSGFSFAASHYGLPDIGFIAWPDLVGFVHRVRALLPRCQVLVDVDDGYGDPEIAAHVVGMLEAAGAWGVVLEDQARPRRCGHLEGKQVLPLDAYLAKLRQVLDARRGMVVVARTDASDPADVLMRARAFEEAGADALLVDGVRDLSLVHRLREATTGPLAFNQIAGGKSPRSSLTELARAGISIAIYSTPCLFAAHGAVDAAMRSLKEADGRLPDAGSGPGVGLTDCVALLEANLARRSDLAPRGD